MTPNIRKRPSTAAAVVFDLLNPIPLGFFVAALLFDAVYVNSADVMWFKSAAWLIAIGLLFAVLPRVINLVRVWFSGSGASTAGDKLSFLLYLLAVAAAIVNSFVHSRDAFGVLPQGLWLSLATVALVLASNAVLTLQNVNDANDADRGHRVQA